MLKDQEWYHPYKGADLQESFPLLFAAYVGDEEMLHRILRTHDLETPGPAGCTAVHYAAACGHIAILHALH